MDKKVCLMLVEGPFDRQRLSVLCGLFDLNKLVIVPFGSDLFTSSSYYLEYNDRITELLSKEKTYGKEDFTEVVQVLDTDGCFIEEAFVFEDKTLKHIVYKASSIATPNLSSYKIERLNKCNNINKLLEDGHIRLFYNSTNIDHAFDNIQNPSRKQKSSLSIKMYNEYKNDGFALLKKMLEICPALNGFNESWEFVKSGFNSLSQCSNILYFVLEHFDDLKEEYKNYLKDILS